MAQSFRDLKVWQESIELTILIYNITSRFPKSEVYGLASQMRRAAVSISSNIAEGSARSSKKHFRQFVLIAKGSTCELQTQLVITNRLRYVPEQEVADIETLAHEVGKKLSGLSSYLTEKISAGKNNHSKHS